MESLSERNNLSEILRYFFERVRTYNEEYISVLKKGRRGRTLVTGKVEGGRLPRFVIRWDKQNFSSPPSYFTDTIISCSSIETEEEMMKINSLLERSGFEHYQKRISHLGFKTIMIHSGNQMIIEPQEGNKNSRKRVISRPYTWALLREDGFLGTIYPPEDRKIIRVPSLQQYST